MSLAETALPDRQIQDQSAEDVYDDGYLRIEHKNYYIAYGRQSIRLPRTEFLIISRLARSVERAVSAEELWEFVWEVVSRLMLRVFTSTYTGCAANFCRIRSASRL
jgi:DNA-binding response OmpR family regulator